MLRIDPPLGAEIVRELARVGAYDDAEAPFGERARTALVDFMHVENLENRVRTDGTIDVQTLDYLRAYKR